jgi:periplasmic protein CpxP/Spy
MRSSLTAVAAALLLTGSSLAYAAETTTTGTTTAPSTATGATVGQTKADPGAASSGTSAPMTEAQVKQKLEKDGYTKVTGLKEEKDGTWMGKAMHEGKEVSVDVDQKGMVTAK